MTIKLPPKPERVQIDRHIPTNYVIRGYTAEQMEAYAREAVRLNMAPLSDEHVRIPASVSEAKAMATVAIAWLRQHAPDELRPEFRGGMT